MHIRLADKEDLLQVASIYNEYLGKATMDLDPVNADHFSHLINSEREKLYVCEIDGSVIGYSAIKKYSPKRGYDKTCETSTFITGEQLNKGYGTTLKKFIIDRCTELNYTHVLARIMSINERSIAYNLKLGFEIVGEQNNVGCIDDKYYDVTIMQRVLQ